MEILIKTNKTIKAILVTLILNIVLKRGLQFLPQKKQILTEVRMETTKIKTKEEEMEEIDKSKEFKSQYLILY
jgi:hypothetical protein